MLKDNDLTYKLRLAADKAARLGAQLRRDAAFLGQQGVMDFSLLIGVHNRKFRVETLGGGATLAGIILGAITVFIIDRQFDKAAIFALAGTVLTFFGFIHNEAIGFGRSPEVSVGYLGVAATLFLCARYASFAPLPADLHSGDGALAEAAE